MLNIKIHILILMGLTSFAEAYEVDNFTRRDEVPKDSIEILDKEINSRIDKALKKANAGFFRDNCNSEDKVKRSESRLKLFTELKEFLVNDSIANGELEEFAKDNAQVAKRKISFDESIYSSVKKFPILKRFGVAPVINVNRVQIGTDKLGHFFNQGYSIYLNNAKRPSYDDRASIGFLDSLESETSLYGLQTTGVKSYADMSANYDGQRFWEKLCGFPKTKDSTRCEPDAYLQCNTDGKWGLNLKQKFTLKDYVTSAWDEAINCSSFDPDNAEGIFNKMNKTAFTYKGNPLQPCPAEPQKCVEILEKYKSVGKKTINPICRNVGKSLKENKPIDATTRFNYSYVMYGDYSKPAEMKNQKPKTKNKQ
ncbi:MAG: hypothetical protein H7328_04645 [Bdellovibrio sp.]|nr:hypothetical protein [Bdellovibrio sp.]